MEKQIKDALLDANQRLRQENAALQAELDKTKKELVQQTVRAAAWMKTAAACDGEDLYGAVYIEAMRPNAEQHTLRQFYLSLTNEGLSGRIAKLEAASGH